MGTLTLVDFLALFELVALCLRYLLISNLNIDVFKTFLHLLCLLDLVHLDEAAFVQI